MRDFTLKEPICLLYLFCLLFILSGQTHNLYLYILNLSQRGFMHETSHTDLASAASLETEMRELVEK